LVASRFKVLSEPHRLRLLQELEAGERSVSDLILATGYTQSNVSRHLHTLAEAGMLERRKDGLSVHLPDRRPHHLRAAPADVRQPAAHVGPARQGVGDYSGVIRRRSGAVAGWLAQAGPFE